MFCKNGGFLFLIWRSFRCLLKFPVFSCTYKNRGSSCSSWHPSTWRLPFSFCSQRSLQDLGELNLICCNRLQQGALFTHRHFVALQLVKDPSWGLNHLEGRFTCALALVPYWPQGFFERLFVWRAAEPIPSYLLVLSSCSCWANPLLVTCGIEDLPCQVACDPGMTPGSLLGPQQLCVFFCFFCRELSPPLKCNMDTQECMLNGWWTKSCTTWDAPKGLDIDISKKMWAS